MVKILSQKELKRSTGYFHFNGRSESGLGGDPHPAVKSFAYVISFCKSESSPHGNFVPAIGASVSKIHYIRQFPNRNSPSGIAYKQSNYLVFIFQNTGNASARFRVFPGICNQIPKAVLEHGRHKNRSAFRSSDIQIDQIIFRSLIFSAVHNFVSIIGIPGYGFQHLADIGFQNSRRKRLPESRGFGSGQYFPRLSPPQHLKYILWFQGI